MKRLYIISHDNCADGLVSAALVQSYATQKYAINYTGHLTTFGNYTEQRDKAILGDILNHTTPDDYDIVIVDYSLPAVMMEQLAGYNVTVLDHHRSARERFPVDIVSSDCMFVFGNHTYIYDERECGASLALLHCCIAPDKELLHFVYLIKDHDLWQHKYGMETKALNMLMQEIISGEGNSVSKVAAVHKLIQTFCADSQAVLAKGAELWSTFLNQCKAYAKRSVSFHQHWRMTDGNHVSGTVYIVPDVPARYHSHVGNTLHVEYGAAVVVMIDPDIKNEYGEFKCRVNTAQGSPIKANTIAEFMGGGGHPHAAGFYATTYKVLDVFSNTYNLNTAINAGALDAKD